MTPLGTFALMTTCLPLGFDDVTPMCVDAEPTADLFVLEAEPAVPGTPEMMVDPTTRTVTPPSRGQEAAPTTRSTTTRARRKCIDTDNPDIDDVAAGHFEVERKLVTHYATHLRDLDALGWARVNKDGEGKAAGFKIGGLQCGNDAYQAGLRNGDVIRSVNGRAVNSIPQALFVYATLHGAERLDVEIERKGSPGTLTYDLR